VHHRDRRVIGDRRGIYSLRTELYTSAEKAERRARHGRRNEDQVEELDPDFGFEGFEWIK
jgi:hypothetical protein